MQTSKMVIMMATYNGENYISEQLDSIIGQTFSNWQLIIRDDASTDKTVDIIRDYMNKEPRIQLLENQTNAHGAYYNFFGLLNDVRLMDLKADFYLYADQDDIWDKDKLDLLFGFYQTRQVEGPTLIYADMRIIDGQGQVTAKSMDALMGIAYTNPISAFMAHKVYGCNTFFNKALFDILPKLAYDAPELDYLSHDNFTTKTAALKGQVFFYPETVMGYRRYGQNVTSKHEYNFTLKRVFKRFAKINDLAKDHALTYKQTLVTTHLLAKQASNQKESDFLNRVDKIINRGGIYAVLMVMTQHINWGKPIKTLSRSFILLSGLYKKYLNTNDEKNK